MKPLPNQQIHLLENYRKLQNLISQYGPPKSLFSDNGPQFSSEVFQKFLASWYIDHITLSPHYLKSNGFIERQIKNIKTAYSQIQPNLQANFLMTFSLV